MRVVSVLVLGIGAIGCRASQPPVEPTATIASAVDAPTAAPTPEIGVSPFAVGTGDADVWGNLEGTSVSDQYGGCGFGRPWSMGQAPESRSFDDLEIERRAIEAELPWARENLQGYRGCVRELTRELDETKGEDELTRVRNELARTRARLEDWQRTIASYEQRLEQIEVEAAAREVEGARRLEQIEAGICPHEPCPPGTVHMRR